MPTSTITNTTTAPDGSIVPSVPVAITLYGQATNGPPSPIPGFRISDGSEVVQTLNITSNTSGVWSTALERNSNITPANSFYVAIEQFPISQGGPKFWYFQVGTLNQTLQAALVTVPPALGSSTFLTQAAGDARYVLSPGTFSGSVGTEVANGAGTAGAAASYSRGDHIHPAPTAVPGISYPNDVAAAGVSTSFAAADHTHAREAPLGNAVATAQTTTSATYGDLTTVGPLVSPTVNHTWSALVFMTCILSNTGAFANFMSVAMSGANTIAASDNNALVSNVGASQGLQATACYFFTGLTSGATTFTAKYRTTGGTATFQFRQIVVWPVL